MAASDKNIFISPQRGSTTDVPSIVLTGDGNDPLTISVLDGTPGSLSVEGSAGQLFSVTNNLTVGSIFSVNDVSGIPSLDIDADGTVSMASFGGNVGIGTSAPATKLEVVGSVTATAFLGPLTGNATTATALVTPRAINGTNFDGSANITTANWGTARTLTFGATGKSVNGSGNVSWTLAEIGVNNSTLTLGTSGIATGSQTWTSNQGTNAAFTVNVPGTNIAQGTRTTTSVPITSSTGTNGTLDAATTLLAGVMTSADKSKLDGIESGAQVNVGTNLGITAGSTAGPIVTSSTGNNATLPTASATASGVITTGAQTWAGVKTFNSTIAGSVSGNAGSATALQTARTINGTSFDGSANITTVNWGTARNITIGSTLRSVDGSGNYLWSLADIGAVAKAGDTMTGFLTLHANPTANLHATTKQYVDGILAANDAMVFKGTLGTGGTYTALPLTHGVGWTIKVITAGTYAGKVAEIGDMYVSLVTRAGSGNVNADWAVLQANIDGAVVGPTSSTDNHVALFNGTSGKVIKSASVVLGNGTLTVNTSGTGLSGSGTFGANQNTNGTITITSNATNANTVSTIVARDASGNFSAGTITAALSGNASTATTAIDCSREIINGSGMDFVGGALNANRTITLGTPSTLTGSTTNAVTTSSHTHAITVNLGITGGTTAGPIVTSSAGTNATIPTASGTASGVVTTGAQTWAGVKTFSSTIVGSISGNAATATDVDDGTF